MGLLENPNVRFNILPENISDFTKSIALLEREIGIIGFDMEDFNKIVLKSQRVDFFTASGDDLKAVTPEFIKYLRDNFGKSKIKMLYVVAANEPPSSEAYEQSVSILKDAFEPTSLYQNIYYSEQKERYKAYLFVAWPV